MSLRLGLVGSGWISRVYLRALARVPEGHAVAVWSRDRQHAERLVREFGLGHATDRLEDLWPHVDVVCVNSPNACHAQHAVAAARAGKHVIVEKPLAVSLAEGEAIVAACREAGVGLAYAEELPFAPKFRRMRDWLESGSLGRPLYVTQREAHDGPYSPWFFSRQWAGGGALMDLACHGIECVRWLLGKPRVVGVTAWLGCGRHPQAQEVDDHAVVQLDFEGGAQALVEGSWLLKGGMQSRLEVWGSEGYAEADLLQRTGLRRFAAGGAAPSWSEENADWLWENGYPQELSHFLHCFRDGSEPEESGADGLVVLEVLSAAYASAARGARVELPFRPDGDGPAIDPWR